jgi:hypothetical protein
MLLGELPVNHKQLLIIYIYKIHDISTCSTIEEVMEILWRLKPGKLLLVTSSCVWMTKLGLAQQI